MYCNHNVLCCKHTAHSMKYQLNGYMIQASTGTDNETKKHTCITIMIFSNILYISDECASILFIHNHVL